MNKLPRKIFPVINWITVLLLIAVFESLSPVGGTTIYPVLVTVSKGLFCWNIFIAPLFFLISVIGSAFHAYRKKNLRACLPVLSHLILLPIWWYIVRTIISAI